MKVSLKIGDIFVILLAIAICVFSILSLSTTIQGDTILTIESPEGVWKYPLDKDRTYEIPGENGISIIGIKEGDAFFIDSACPNHTCVLTPPISKGGEWIGCLPNRVFIRIEGEQKTEFDAVGY